MFPMTFHIVGVFAILALAWVLFFFWVVGLVVRAVWFGFRRLTGMATRTVSLSTKPRRCTRLRCLVVNPPQANFCRRCGDSLTRLGSGRQTSENPRRWVSSSTGRS
jgi:hypothetical protein